MRSCALDDFKSELTFGANDRYIVAYYCTEHMEWYIYTIPRVYHKGTFPML